MDLSELICLFNEKNSAMDQLIGSEDVQAIQELDKSLSETFDEILNYNADSLDEKLQLLDFLLSILVPEINRTPSQKDIIDKLENLISE